MQKEVSSQPLGHNDLCSHANSKVDIDDISLTLNPFFNSPLRDDLLINFLVSLFTSYKNLRSVRFNLGKICVKQISSHFTIKPHNDKESLSSPLKSFAYERRRLNQAQRKGGRRRRRRRKSEAFFACDFKAFSKGVYGKKKLHCTEHSTTQKPTR